MRWRPPLEGDAQTFRRAWLVAEAGVRLTHSMLLPVPPIYGGHWGEPGLLREDWALAAEAPPGVADALLAAAEADLAAAGARLLLASTAPGGPWQGCYERHGYERLTLYLAKALPGGGARPGEARPATGDDIPEIVTRSAENRIILAALDAFWTPHVAADARFDRRHRRLLPHRLRRPRGPATRWTGSGGAASGGRGRASGSGPRRGLRGLPGGMDLEARRPGAGGLPDGAGLDDQASGRRVAAVRVPGPCLREPERPREGRLPTFPSD
jgi:hypothetical protein